jgi:glycosyltransferase involved in cell wall biosynthesis
MMGKLANTEFPKEITKKGWPWDNEVDEKLYSGIKNWPKITIITPSYNQEAFLEETIRSIVLQNYPNLEYIIMDGGSNDNSIDIIKKYESHLSYFVSEKDFGQSHAINKGFAMATGDILNWINSDDTLCRNALFSIAEAYGRRKSANVVIMGNGYEIDEQSNIIMERLGYKPTREEANTYLNIAGNPIQQSLFFSKKLFFESGGINPLIKYPMDIDLLFKFSFLKAEIIFSEAYLGNFRKHSLSKTVSQDYKMLLEKISLLKFLSFYDHNKQYYKNLTSGYIASYSFKGISFRQKIKLIITFMINTPFDKKYGYKYRLISNKLFKS